MACEFHAELEVGKDGLELVVTLVNVSPKELPDWDTTVYEASLIVDAGETLPFTLDNLPDSFRYDRTVAGLRRERRRREDRRHDLPHD